MARLLRMPAVAAGSAQAVLQDWQLPEGTPFSASDVLATVETDKAVVDLEAEADGVLLKTLVGNGTQVGTGEPIAVLANRGEEVGDLDVLLVELGVAEPVAPTGKTPTSLLARPATADGGVAEPAAPPADGAPHPTRTFASPLARRLARDAGLSLTELTGTGPGNRILRRDVEQALQTPTPERVVTATYTDVPHSRIRKAIAARLTESQRTPHFSLRGTCRVDALLETREQLNAVSTTRISINDMVIKAAARAHVLVPAMNVVWTQDAVRVYSSVDISVAIATDGGLVVPVLRGVDRLSISQVAQRTQEYVKCAKDGTLRQDQLEGGTLSITNLGMYGTEEFAAIINPPQSAILAVGAARQEVVVADGAAAVATVMRVTLSVDHRPIDGAIAAQWLRAFTDLVEHPVRTLV